MSKMPSATTMSNEEMGTLAPVVGRLLGPFAAGVVFAAGIIVAAGVLVVAAPAEAAMTWTTPFIPACS